VFGLSPTFVATEIPETQSLLAEARAGDAEAFGELCRIHGTRLLRQAVALCGNLSLAEDLAQDTLVEGWKCLSRYNGNCQFFTWLCAILLNRYRNTLRGNRLVSAAAIGRRGQAEFANQAVDETDHSAQPDQAVERNEQAALMRQFTCAFMWTAHWTASPPLSVARWERSNPVYFMPWTNCATSARSTHK
jgi:RNA polymerase sigma-70 factor (ECF subfamily)